jgi:hypothetical protein
MKFFYIDESEGSGSDPFNDIYLLGTVIVDESRLQSTEADIRQLSATIFGASHATFEFHGYDIYHGKGQFSGMNVPQRIAIVTSLMDIPVLISITSKLKAAEDRWMTANEE